jgi:hypothetical protein
MASSEVGICDGTSGEVAVRNRGGPRCVGPLPGEGLALPDAPRPLGLAVDDKTCHVRPESERTEPQARASGMDGRLSSL